MATTTENWMSSLDDKITLDKISIPGTHDSGTEKTGAGPAHTQNFGIRNQLDNGIRFLDIRVTYKKSNPANDPLQIYHGIINCDISFGDVLNDCLNFLNTNPQETIIMLVNSASGKETDIQQYFDVYLRQSQYQNLFYLNAVPTQLGAMRKKIVLFRRYLGTGGVDLSQPNAWQDNKTFSLTTPQGVQFYIEDQYSQHNTKKKWSAVASNLDKAKGNPNDTIIYITFNSISFGGHTPYQYAWGGGIGKVDPKMNPVLQSYLESNSGANRFGIIPLDFFNNKTGDINNSNTELIINSNPGVQLT